MSVARFDNSARSSLHGFTLVPGFVTTHEESSYLQALDRAAFPINMMRGRALRRRILAFGIGFGPNFQSFCKAERLPDYVRDVRSAVAGVLRVAPRYFNQALVQRFAAGATIGWHVDSDVFGAPIVGLSLGADATLSFRAVDARAVAGTMRDIVAVRIPRRSLYIMDGESRAAWLHKVGSIAGTRYSITLRHYYQRAQTR